MNKEAGFAVTHHRDGFDRAFPAQEVAGILFFTVLFAFMFFVAVPALLRRGRI